jgi:hypothetical protein
MEPSYLQTSAGVRALDSGRSTLAFDGTTLFVAGLAATNRFVTPVGLTEDGTPALEVGGLSSSESFEDDAPCATAIACSLGSGILAVAVGGKKVTLYDRSMSLIKIVYSALLPVRALAFDTVEKLL